MYDRRLRFQCLRYGRDVLGTWLCGNAHEAAGIGPGGFFLACCDEDEILTGDLEEQLLLHADESFTELKEGPSLARWHAEKFQEAHPNTATAVTLERNICMRARRGAVIRFVAGIISLSVRRS